MWAVIFVCYIRWRQLRSGRLFAPSHRKSKKSNPSRRSAARGYFLVPMAGVEPARYRYQRILSPSRLPIPSHRQISFSIISQYFVKIKRNIETAAIFLRCSHRFIKRLKKVSEYDTIILLHKTHIVFQHGNTFGKR